MKGLAAPSKRDGVTDWALRLAYRAVFIDLISRSHEPPKCIALGGLKTLNLLFSQVLLQGRVHPFKGVIKFAFTSFEICPLVRK